MAIRRTPRPVYPRSTHRTSASPRTRYHLNPIEGSLPRGSDSSRMELDALDSRTEGSSATITVPRRALAVRELLNDEPSENSPATSPAYSFVSLQRSEAMWSEEDISSPFVTPIGSPPAQPNLSAPQPEAKPKGRKKNQPLDPDHANTERARRMTHNEYNEKAFELGVPYMGPEELAVYRKHSLPLVEKLKSILRVLEALKSAGGDLPEEHRAQFMNHARAHTQQAFLENQRTVDQNSTRKTRANRL